MSRPDWEDVPAWVNWIAQYSKAGLLDIAENRRKHAEAQAAHNRLNSAEKDERRRLIEALRPFANWANYGVGTTGYPEWALLNDDEHPVRARHFQAALKLLRELGEMNGNKPSGVEQVTREDLKKTCVALRARVDMLGQQLSAAEHQRDKAMFYLERTEHELDAALNRRDALIKALRIFARAPLVRLHDSRSYALIVAPVAHRFARDLLHELGERPNDQRWDALKAEAQHPSETLSRQIEALAHEPSSDEFSDLDGGEPWGPNQ